MLYLSSRHPWLRATSEASVSRLHFDKHNDSISRHPLLRVLIVSSVTFYHRNSSIATNDHILTRNLAIARKNHLPCSMYVPHMNWLASSILTTTTTTATTTVLWPFVWDYPGELVSEETFTHSHLSWSSIILYLLPPFTTIHSIFPVQFMCLTVFFAQPLSKSSLVYLSVWYCPLHTPYISSPNHCLIFTIHAHTNATCFTLVPR